MTNEKSPIQRHRPFDEIFEDMAAGQYAEISSIDVQDQENRTEELQLALAHSCKLFRALHCERIDPKTAHAATYFASQALETLSHGMAEDAVKFAARHRQLSEMSLNANDTAAEGEAAA